MLLLRSLWHATCHVINGIKGLLKRESNEKLRLKDNFGPYLDNDLTIGL